MRINNKYCKSALLVIATILILARVGYSFETKRFPQGFAFELGAGYDQLYWKHPGGSNNRLAFSISPTIRALYGVHLKNNIYLIPFIGYDRLGGKSSTKDNGYIDEYWWNCVNFGSIISTKPKDYEIGIGIKTNVIIRSIGRYYGGFDWPADSERSWSKNNWTSEFAKISFDCGIRFGCGKKHLYSAIEAWLGFGNLVKGSGFADAGVKARENHFRLLLGYRL
jgi:hypothetical protein